MQQFFNAAASFKEYTCFINFEAASFAFFCQFCHVFLLIKKGASPDTVIPIDPTTILIADSKVNAFKSGIFSNSSNLFQVTLATFYD
jgi:hypothetical protein